MCSIPEHGCPQSDPSPMPLSELDWSRPGFLLGSQGTWLLCRLKGTRAVPPVARCRNCCVQVLLYPPPSWGLCSSWRFKARQFPVCLSLICHLLRHEAKLQTTVTPGRTACSSAEETPGPGRASVPGHVCFYIPELLFSPQTAIRACPPYIMHAQLHLHFPWDCHCQDKSSFSPYHCSSCSGLVECLALPSNTSSHYKSLHI